MDLDNIIKGMQAELKRFDNPNAQMQRGNALLAVGRRADAIKDFQQAAMNDEYRYRLFKERLENEELAEHFKKFFFRDYFLQECADKFHIQCQK